MQTGGVSQNLEQNGMEKLNIEKEANQIPVQNTFFK